MFILTSRQNSNIGVANASLFIPHNSTFGYCVIFLIKLVTPNEGTGWYYFSLENIPGLLFQ